MTPDWPVVAAELLMLPACLAAAYVGRRLNRRLTPDPGTDTVVTTHPEESP